MSTSEPSGDNGIHGGEEEPRPDTDLPTGRWHDDAAPHLPAAGEPSILLVDDNASTLRLLKRMLAEEGIHAIICTDALEAVRIAHTEAIDALFVDLRMRPIDGLEVLRRTQGAIARRYILTGYADAAEEQQALALGAMGVLHKPVDVEEIIRLATGD